MKLPPNREYVTLNDTVTANGADAVVTIDADAAEAWVIDEIVVSAGSITATATLTVAFGGVTKFQVDISAAGVFPFTFEHGLMTGTKNEAVVVTLPDLGGADIGKVNVNYR